MILRFFGVGKDVLLPFSIMMLLVAIGCYSYYNHELDQLKQQKIENELINMERSEYSVSGRFASILSDIRILVSFHNLNAVDDEHSAKAHGKVAEMYRTLLTQKTRYDQIRIIDVSGMETLRINRSEKGDGIIVSFDQLQDKKDRYYFKEALPLAKDQFYVSSLDLNVEHGKVEYPIKPMIRFSTPLFDMHEKLSGILVVNYLAQELLGAFEGAHTNPLQISSVGNMMLLNKEGYYLHQNDPEKLWGFMFKEKNELSFAHEFPKEWQMIPDSGNDHMAIETENGIFIYDHIKPFHELSGELKFSTFGANQWTIIAHIAPSLIKPLKKDILLKTINIFLVILLITVSLVSIRARFIRMNLKLKESVIKSAIQDSAFEAIFTSDEKGYVTDANPAALKEWDATIESFVGKSVSTFISVSADESGVFPQMNNEEVEAKYFDETSFTAEISISHFVSNDFKGFTVFLRNIDEKKRLHAEHLKLSKAVEHANESILLTNSHGIIEYVNPAFERISGYTAKELIGNTPAMMKSGKHDESFYRQLWETISSGYPWKGNIVDRRKDGSFFPSRLTISPIKNETGEVTHYVGFQEDLTEMEELERQFQQAQKMEALGTLVGGIAHDFNNTLAGIIGNTYLMKNKVKGLPGVYEKVEIIEKLSYQASDMIKQLLTFSRVESGNMHPLKLVPFIKEVLKFYEVALPENIHIQQRVQSVDLDVNADVNQLQQAFMNLLNNARDAVENVSNPLISISLAELEVTDEVRVAHECLSSRVVCLSVSDNGEGIKRENIEHIFEPFFTTKVAGKGTGLGLAMVYGAIKSHDGYVDVESEIGLGTTFKVYLPLLEAGYTVEDEHVTTDDLHVGSGEIILLVDDNEQLRMTTAELLKQFGYEVLCASDGAEAVEMYKAKGKRIALIISDVVMPYMSGPEAINKIREFNKDAKVIYVSGYDLKGQVAVNIDQSEKILSKPVNMEVFRNAIRESLDSI